ncbi:MAG: DUF4115 domain-containing protein [Deltaproteobacteria bacterium]|nr:DUF4115 domain-containing protein [Deltaproteobacteria bacterium]MBI3293861.1 DUF4115 domain-containing protein [Deltaproteobacteria bacterium]
MENFGAYLKAQREAKNIRLEEIASITKIHIHNLQLLEKGEYGQLPPEPFLRGFIIAYSKYIGLDTKEAVKRFQESRMPASTAGADSAGSESKDTYVQERNEPVVASTNDVDALITSSRFTGRHKVMAGFGVVALVLILGVVSYVGRQSPGPLSADALKDQEAAVEKTDAEKTASATGLDEDKKDAVDALLTMKGTVADVKPATDEKSEKTEKAEKKENWELTAKTTETVARETAAEKPAINKEEAAKKHEMTVEGNARTWMKVVIDNEKPKETFLKEKEVVTLSAGEKIKVVLGNSTGTKVTYNGETVKGEKFSGTIRSYIFPKSARFPQDPPKRTTATKDGTATSNTTPALADKEAKSDKPAEELPPVQSESN